MKREKWTSKIGDMNSKLHQSIIDGEVGKAEKWWGKIKGAIESINVAYPHDNPFYQHRSGVGIEKVVRIRVPDAPFGRGGRSKSGTTKRGRPRKRYCACGCGEEVGRLPSVFCRGHDSKIKKKFKEYQKGRGKLSKVELPLYVMWKRTGMLTIRG